MIYRVVVSGDIPDHDASAFLDYLEDVGCPRSVWRKEHDPATGGWAWVSQDIWAWSNIQADMEQFVNLYPTLRVTIALYIYGALHATREWIGALWEENQA